METGRVLRGPERRRMRRFFVFRERRSGFDRRARSRSWLGSRVDGYLDHLRDHPASLALLLLLANVASMIDLALTWSSLSLGAMEVNPLMRHLLALGHSPVSAAAGKQALVGAMSLAIWRFRSRRQVLALGVVLPVVFCAVVLYELIGVAWLL